MGSTSGGAIYPEDPTVTTWPAPVAAAANKLLVAKITAEGATEKGPTVFISLSFLQ